MARPVTLFTGQWGDLPLAELAPLAKKMGYDGLELACRNNHFDVSRALTEDSYVEDLRAFLEGHGLACYAVANHGVGQAVCDSVGPRHRGMLPAHVWGDGDLEGLRTRAAEEMKRTARAAAKFGVGVVNGFTGSRVWERFYPFPALTPEELNDGYEDFARRWGPILDVFDEVGVRFALEVHPTEIAYDLYTAEKALETVGHREAFGFNFDPSHLFWQFVDPVRVLNRFGDRIYHVHMKDAARTLDGETSILASHLPFGDPRRGWDFRSVGRGQVDFESIVRALNRLGYGGPLSVEWEDSGMDRIEGATESAQFVRKLDFTPSERPFDAPIKGRRA